MPPKSRSFFSSANSSSHSLSEIGPLCFSLKVSRALLADSMSDCLSSFRAIHLHPLWLQPSLPCSFTECLQDLQTFVAPNSSVIFPKISKSLMDGAWNVSGLIPAFSHADR